MMGLDEFCVEVVKKAGHYVNYVYAHKEDGIRGECGWFPGFYKDFSFSEAEILIRANGLNFKISDHQFEFIKKEDDQFIFESLSRFLVFGVNLTQPRSIVIASGPLCSLEQCQEAVRYALPRVQTWKSSLGMS
ncbi:uncharacterized protein LOC143452262 [Clavelina lepadiformis]|uniref:Uncharacterized protein n=1 Tax=Clavelina lepadiformis TaxID=159417 RepID=A0ABP0GUG2_CLALP